MAKRYYWLKMREDFFSDAKVKKLRRIAGGDTYTVIYLKMLLLSIRDAGIIKYEGVEPTFAEELALKLDESEDNIAVTLSYLMTHGLIEVYENQYMLPEATQSIGSETSGAARMRKMRNSKKEQSFEAMYGTDSQKVSHCDGDIDIERDIEKEKDIDLAQRHDVTRAEGALTRQTKNHFLPPSINDIEAYAKENGLVIDAQRFRDYYAATGWMRGNTPIRDWQALARRWRERDNGQHIEQVAADDTSYI